MSRLRLRFLLQEFDLSGSEVVLGRSPDCHITIEDPLVSRRHALIRIVEGEAFVSDLESRNGVRVNGKTIRQETRLQHGDRVRLGTQDLVFLQVQDSEVRSTRTTGYLQMCGSCGTPFPDSAPQCPHCGFIREDPEEDTLSGVFSEVDRGWTIHLLCDVLDRALDKDRLVDAERLFRRVTREVEERLAQGGRLLPDQLSRLADLTMRLTAALQQPDWLRWLITVYQRGRALPSSRIVEGIEAFGGGRTPEFSQALQSYVSWCRLALAKVSSAPGQEVEEGIRRLEALSQNKPS